VIRFRNPGTEYSTQIQVIKELYSALSQQEFFSLDDMALVIAKSKLMTAYGYAGTQAIELSHTDQESLNSAKMNAKMYAEVFRMLGWVTPYNLKASYPLCFTYIGAHIALSEGDCSQLYEQCVLGINNPTQLTNKMSYTEQVRFFKCALRTLIDLGGTMYKHELCIGPMSIDDNNEEQYHKMIIKIKNIRGDISRLKSAFKQLAIDLGMKETPVDNCTRLPIAFMKSCGWVETIKDITLYNISMTCIKITNHGRQVYEEIKDMTDIRLNDFEICDTNVQNALIRLGTYRMLIRARYNLDSVKEVIERDTETCKVLLDGHDILFSPCQTIRRLQVEEALNIGTAKANAISVSTNTFKMHIGQKNREYNLSTIELGIFSNATKEELINSEDANFIKTVKKLHNDGLTSEQIVNDLFELYRNANQSTFYPLIATLFKIMGFDCSYSRAGDNGARWDAIIKDDKRSIPIEIKSPTEETHLSIKAIRQALENKIILLSRKTFITDKATTSLAVGYYLPNERAEVADLIENIKCTFEYKIGVLDFNSLLSIAVSILINGKGIDLEKIFDLEGLTHASI
jgi:hypothetical protein